MDAATGTLAGKVALVTGAARDSGACRVHHSDRLRQADRHPWARGAAPVWTGQRISE